MEFRRIGSWRFSPSWNRNSWFLSFIGVRLDLGIQTWFRVQANVGEDGGREELEKFLELDVVVVQSGGHRRFQLPNSRIGLGSILLIRFGSNLLT
jgi:hypothetical protein